MNQPQTEPRPTPHPPPAPFGDVVLRWLRYQIIRRKLISLSFWRVNLAAWLVFAMMTFLVRCLFHLDIPKALILTILNESLALGASLILRRYYQRFGIPFRLRTALSVVAVSLFWAVILSVATYLITLATGWRMQNITDLESSMLRFTIMWTALLGWSLGYFWFQAEKAWTAESRHAEEAEHQAHRMELQMLRAQLDPHFLFNSLNGIAAEVHAHPDDAVEMICRLSDYLRYSLEHRKQTFTALESELGAMQAYLEIEKARFGDRLRFSVDASPEALTHRVPTFILQPLVENALKWGFQQSASAMTVDIRAFQTAGVLEIEVMNNGHLESTPRDKAGGLGLDTLSRRLDIYYPGRHHFTLEQRGAVVCATIQLWGAAEAV